MDRSIPLGGGYSIGLDPLIGLVPGVGDLLSTIVSGMIILLAQRAGLPKSTIWRMMVNVAIDSAVGAIPFLGDAFDFVWKANQRNVDLYRQSVAGAHSTKSDHLFLALVLICLAVILSLPVILVVWLVRAVL